VTALAEETEASDSASLLRMETLRSLTPMMSRCSIRVRLVCKWITSTSSGPTSVSVQPKTSSPSQRNDRDQCICVSSGPLTHLAEGPGAGRAHRLRAVETRSCRRR
jgi:hypothetical protein